MAESEKIKSSSEIGALIVLIPFEVMVTLVAARTIRYRSGE